MIPVCKVSDIPVNAGSAVLVEGVQIAIFNIAGEFYATQNLCPHKQQMVLSRGLLGDEQGTYKVACPLHKKLFDLQSGKHLGEEDWCLDTYPVEVRGEDVYLDPVAK